MRTALTNWPGYLVAFLMDGGRSQATSHETGASLCLKTRRAIFPLRRAVGQRAVSRRNVTSASITTASGGNVAASWLAAGAIGPRAAFSRCRLDSTPAQWLKVQPVSHSRSNPSRATLCLPYLLMAVHIAFSQLLSAVLATDARCNILLFDWALIPAAVTPRVELIPASSSSMSCTALMLCR